MKTLILLVGVAIGLYLGTGFINPEPLPHGHYPVENARMMLEGTIVGQAVLGKYAVVRVAVPGSGYVFPVVPAKEYQLSEKVSIKILTYTIFEQNGQGIRLYHEAPPG